MKNVIKPHFCINSKIELSSAYLFQNHPWYLRPAISNAPLWRQLVVYVPHNVVSKKCLESGEGVDASAVSWRVRKEGGSGWADLGCAVFDWSTGNVLRVNEATAGDMMQSYFKTCPQGAPPKASRIILARTSASRNVSRSFFTDFVS